MIRGTDIAGLVGVILLTIAIICYLIRPVTNLNWRRHIVCATIPILIWKASSLITILRGITGDLSISSVLFLLLFLSNNLSIRHNLKIKDLYATTALVHPQLLNFGVWGNSALSICVRCRTYRYLSFRIWKYLFSYPFSIWHNNRIPQ